MKGEYFINEAIEVALNNYKDSQNNKDSILYNSFLVVVIRILVLIYGEADLLNPYYLNNKITFLNNLSKYGLSKSDIAIFISDLFNFYKLEEENKKRVIKVKNPYFKNILKQLVDMFTLKRKTVGVNYIDEEEFLELCYTSHTKNPYRLSYNYLMSDDINFIEKYYYSKINELDVTKELSKTINMNLNLEALNYVGVNLTNIKDMSDKELIDAQNKAYNYFQVDAMDPNRDNLLNDSLNYLKTYGKRKVTTGNGYVDILLLMSVIATSFSIFAIIIFSL